MFWLSWIISHAPYDNIDTADEMEPMDESLTDRQHDNTDRDPISFWSHEEGDVTSSRLRHQR